jgi:ketosteroid isomerase-like protein
MLNPAFFREDEILTAIARLEAACAGRDYEAIAQLFTFDAVLTGLYFNTRFCCADEIVRAFNHFFIHSNCRGLKFNNIRTVIGEYRTVVSARVFFQYDVYHDEVCKEASILFVDTGDGWQIARMVMLSEINTAEQKIHAE